MEKNYIAHSGILGMKWGRRRYQNEDGTYTEEGKARRRYEYANATELSDEELRERTNRMNLERNYYEAQSNYSKTMRDMELRRIEASKTSFQKFLEKPAVKKYLDKTLESVIDKTTKAISDSFKKPKEYSNDLARILDKDYSKMTREEMESFGIVDKDGTYNLEKLLKLRDKKNKDD